MPFETLFFGKSPVFSQYLHSERLWGGSRRLILVCRCSKLQSLICKTNLSAQTHRPQYGRAPQTFCLTRRNLQHPQNIFCRSLFRLPICSVLFFMFYRVIFWAWRPRHKKKLKLFFTRDGLRVLCWNYFLFRIIFLL